MAAKNKAKTPEDEKNFKLSEKVYEMLDKEVIELFNDISKKDGKPVFGVIDRTIEIEDLIKFFKKVEILWNETPPQREKPIEEPEEPKQEAEGEADEEKEQQEDEKLNETSKSKAADKSKSKIETSEVVKEGEGEGDAPVEEPEEKSEEFKCPDDMISLRELIHIIEKYYNPEKTLAALIRSSINQDDYNKEYNIHKLTNRYYMHIKGSELILHEFKEILLEISILLKEKKDDGSGKSKVRSMLKKFIEESLLKRYEPFKSIAKGAALITPTPTIWPDSHKDELIKQRKEAERIRQAEEKKRKEEQERQERELELMRAEDTPALSPEEIEELRKKQELEEKLKKEQEEADALDEEHEDELDEDELDDDEAIDNSDN